jgi:peptide-methionine (S)-S-oxide reductase
MFWTTLAAFACSQPTRAGDELPRPEKDVPATQPAGKQTAVFAAGCFWCVEAVFEQLEGVGDVVSGYAGGAKADADYRKVSSGATKHAEVVQVTYDPAKLTYGQLLRVFFATHDPTTKDRQGPDQGHHYRSAIFYETEEQKQVAEAYIQQLTDAKVFSRPIVTTLEKLDAFYPAEQYHQDFVTNNPTHPYVRQWAVPKVLKVQEKFGDKVKGQAEKE